MAVEVAQHAARIETILGTTSKIFIGGEWVTPASNETIESHDPGSGTFLASVPLGGAEDIDAAVNEARRAFQSWKVTAPLERAQHLWRIADILEAHAEELAFLETMDTGKPLDHAKNYDLKSAINEFRFMSGLAARINGQAAPMATMPGGTFHSFTRLQPLGVIGAITPWNFPLANTAWKIAPALACGNTVVVKPSEETPLTTLRLAQLMVDAGLPRGVVNIVTGDGSTGRALVNHPGVDKITFTGSTATGQHIAKVASDKMTRVALELGGKSPNVVFADADVDAAIAGASAASFWDSGEVCSAGTRMYVERSIMERVVDGFRSTVEAMPIGHGLDPETLIGPLISRKHRNKVAGYVDGAREEGLEIAFGGESLEGDGNFYRPTAILGAKSDSRVLREEIFGPVVTIVPFDEMNEVLTAANDSDYGLAAGVWTSDMTKAHHFAENVEAGMVWVNCYGVVDPTLPWGGFKKSGWGRENGEYALQEFTEPKGVCMKL
jgi:phenylacetaldehyde dehydrogenase